MSLLYTVYRYGTASHTKPDAVIVLVLGWICLVDFLLPSSLPVNLLTFLAPTIFFALAVPGVH